MDGLVTTCRSSSCDVYNHGEKSIKQSPGKGSSKNMKPTTNNLIFLQEILGELFQALQRNKEQTNQQMGGKRKCQKVASASDRFWGDTFNSNKLNVQTKQNIQSNYKMI